MIYLDNAATTLRKPPQVIEAVAAAMATMGNSSRGTHGGALAAAEAVFRARGKLAKLFNCRPDHVAFTCNSTEALNIAIPGLISPGDHVISTDLEHNSVLRPLYRLEAEQDVALSFLPADGMGRVDCQDFERLMRANTRAIVCTHASNLTGDMLDLYRIGDIARKFGLLLIVDASQTAGYAPIDMEGMHIDALCFTGHKGLMGPQGTGGLCLRAGLEVRPLKVGGSGVQSYSRTHPAEMPARLEAGTLNGHGIAGLSAAVDFIESTGIDKIYAHEYGLMRRFYEGVSRIDGVAVYGGFDLPRRAAIVALNIWDQDSDAVAFELSESYGIATRPGAHCAPRLHKALGTAERGAVRFSFAYFNTADEVDAAIRAVEELAR